MFRGFSKSKSNRSSHTSSHSRRESESKTELAITAPRQIVRALYPYKAEQSQELSFQKNDFFYVNDEPAGEWYVAYNPLQNTRGLVPMSYFEVVQRQDNHSVPVSEARKPHARTRSAASASSHATSSSRGSAGYSVRPGSGNHVPFQAGPGSRRDSNALNIYGYVLYDFQAERSDELTVTAGESIVIVAQSTADWFVAKPIGRVGGPGLIPVTYVELREVGTDRVLTDVEDTVRRASLPQVEEWKRKLAEYKASSIPLGRFGATAEQADSTTSVKQHSRSPSMQPVEESVPEDREKQFVSAEPYIVRANVDRFAINGGRYWYLVKVEMSNGKHRNLCRYYQDFYDFQIKLLEQFPVEAGRTGRTRTLPFMPGPLTLITHTVSSQRRANLDEYVGHLIRMPPYISQSQVVLDLFSIHTGDIERDIPSDEVPRPPEDDIGYSGDMPEENMSVVSNTTHTFEALYPGQTPTPRDHPKHQLHDGNEFDMEYRDHSNTSIASPIREPLSTLTEGSVSTATVDELFSQTEPFVDARETTHPYGERTASLGRPPVYKIKVYTHDEVFAIRVPTSTPFQEIYEKIAARLNVKSPKLYTSPEYSGSSVNSDEDFKHALNNNTKVALYLGP